MITMYLREIAVSLDGELIGPGDILAQGVSIDSRTLIQGNVFVAIEGQNFDGHAFVLLAEQMGAVGVIVQKKIDTRLTQIIVANTKLALIELAHQWRSKLSTTIVGVTGSNGKTTTKEMLASILSVKGQVLFTQGNLNNEIGLPLTLLRLSPHHEYAVIEMGANHVGEIAYLSQCAMPDIAIITNVGAAHLEGFGDEKTIAKAKGEIFEALSDHGIAILNANDPYFKYWLGVIHQRKYLSFGLTSAADVYAENNSFECDGKRFVTRFEIKTPKGSASVSLSLAGQHNVLNALAATAASLSLGCSLNQIKQGLEVMKPISGRLELCRGRKGNLIINDVYNANTSSLAAALEVLLECSGERWVVLGAFGELGAESERLHSEMAITLKKAGVTRLFALGEQTQLTVNAFGEYAQHFASHQLLLETLMPLLQGTETLLIKGSRAQRMEKITAALVETTGF